MGVVEWDPGEGGGIQQKRSRQQNTDDGRELAMWREGIVTQKKTG